MQTIYLINSFFIVRRVRYNIVNVKNSNFIQNSDYGISVRGTVASFGVVSHCNFWENEEGDCGYNENC